MFLSLEKAIGGIEDQVMGIVKQSMAFAGGFEDLLNSFLMEYTKGKSRAVCLSLWLSGWLSV